MNVSRIILGLAGKCRVHFHTVLGLKHYILARAFKNRLLRSPRNPTSDDLLDKPPCREKKPN